MVCSPVYLSILEYTLQYTLSTEILVGHWLEDDL